MKMGVCPTDLWNVENLYLADCDFADISGITMLAALSLIIKAGDQIPLLVFGSVALGFALFNVIGGFLVTDRMLAMFSRKKTSSKDNP